MSHKMKLALGCSSHFLEVEGQSSFPKLLYSGAKPKQASLHTQKWLYKHFDLGFACSLRLFRRFGSTSLLAPGPRPSSSSGPIPSGAAAPTSPRDLGTGMGRWRCRIGASDCLVQMSFRGRKTIEEQMKFDFVSLENLSKDHKMKPLPESA